jgi:hypothetical protein
MVCPLSLPCFYCSGFPPVLHMLICLVFFSVGVDLSVN